MSRPVPVTIRDMTPADWPAVVDIYAAGIRSRLATFETSIPEWGQWNAAHLAAPRLIAESAGAIVGWAALNPVSGRAAYRGVAEVSVYVAPAAQRRGIGRELLATLIERADRAGLWTLQAAILARNVASIGLHERCGFRRIGHRERIAQLDGEWLDTLLLERRRRDGRPSAASAVVHEFIERINAHDVDGLLPCLSPDHRFIDSLGAVFVGRETLRQGWLAYFALVSDYRVSVHGMAETAAGLLLVGEAAGRSNGLAWTVPAAWRAVVRAGLVAEWQVYADNEPLRASLRPTT
jgi:phosphinothricin acetyltransferase